MNLLANENVPGDVVALLRARGHDVCWIRTDQPGAPDGAILEIALAQARLLLTFDKDFGELVFSRGRDASRGIVLSRLRMVDAPSVAHRAVTVLEARSDWDGQFSVVEDARVRMTPLPAVHRGE